MKNSLILLIVLLSGVQSLAQTQGKKPSPAPTIPTSSSAPAPDTSAAGSQEPRSSDKMDLNKLEEKYWSAKDDDFTVVQNRAYPKANRWALSLHGGKPINDNYREGNMTGLTAGYFFSERYGLELQYQSFASDYSELVKQFVAEKAVYPNGNSFMSSKTLAFQFVPFYAKMSFLDKNIIYFDMAIGVGVGTTDYRIEKIEGGENKSAMHFSLDITQHFFLSEKFAFRFDFRNKWTNEDRARYYPVGAEERSLGSKQVNDTSLLLGLTYWH